MGKMLREEDLYTGREVEAKFAVNPDPYLYNCYIPVKIGKEYPKWWDSTVLPHINPNESQGISKPYPMSIKKWDIKCGDVKLREKTNKAYWR